jgi:hypothetical protein
MWQSGEDRDRISYEYSYATEMGVNGLQTYIIIHLHLIPYTTCTPLVPVTTFSLLYRLTYTSLFKQTTHIPHQANHAAITNSNVHLTP